MKGFKYKINIALQGAVSSLIYAFYFSFSKIAIKKKIFCDAIFSGTTMHILCDGRVSCSCRDTTGEFNLGNTLHQPIFEIWQGEKYSALRHSFIENKIPHKICTTCPSFRFVDRRKIKYDIASFPTGIYFENTAACNLNCFACKRDVIAKKRSVFVMPKEKAQKLLNEIASLGKPLNSFAILGQGEPFLDDNFCYYVKIIKEKMPGCHVFTSTNGICLDGADKIKKIIGSGIDRIVFSIDGATKKSYLKYQTGGDFDKAIENMKRFVAVREEMHSKTPEIVWQYILFRWNDSCKEMRAAENMARDIGVDRLVFHTTMVPILCISIRSILFVLTRLFQFIKKEKNISLISNYEFNFNNKI